MAQAAVNAVDHNYIGHNYTGHNHIGHNYTGHNSIGHNYTGHSFLNEMAPEAAVNALSEYKGAVTALSQSIRNKSAYLMGVLRK